jgi:hypothetical protein
MATVAKVHDRLPWYGWILVPLVLPAVLVIAIPLGILALFSTPYYLVFPDHHRHMWDLEGTPHQRYLLSKWRTRYSRLGIFGRIGRAFARRVNRSIRLSKASRVA